MRQIKFRAWDELSKLMISNDELIRRDFNPLRDWNKFKKMQYTGLKDKKGVEIYEADIVYFKIRTIGDRWEETRYEVKFTNGSFMLIETFDITEFTRELRLWAYNCEVIGNIYENPELLKETM